MSTFGVILPSRFGKGHHSDCRPRPIDLLKDLLAIGLPDESLGIFVQIGNVIRDRLLKLGDGSEAAVPYAVSGDLAEETLHEVQPGA